MAGGLMGIAIFYIFVCLFKTFPCLSHHTSSSQLSLFNYIIDAYLVVAASALASSTVIRSLSGAVFPVRSLLRFRFSNFNIGFPAIRYTNVRSTHSTVGIIIAGLYRPHYDPYSFCSHTVNAFPPIHHVYDY